MRHPSALAALALLAGVAIGFSVHSDARTWAALLAVSWLAAAASVALRRPAGLLLAAMVGFAAGGAALARVRAEAIERPPLRAWFDLHADAVTGRLDLAWLEGRLRGDAAPTDYGARLDIDVTSATAGGQTTPVAGGVRVGVNGQFTGASLETWRAGRMVRFPASLRRPARYLNPGAPDQELALARRNIVLLASVKSAALVEVVGGAGAWQEVASQARAQIRAAVNASVGWWSARSAAVVTAIVIGDRAGLSPDEARALQDAGTYHVMAISGGNLAILAGVLYAVLKRTPMGRRHVAWVTLACLATYGLLVEGGASVGRAVIMAVAVLAAIGLDHHTEPLNAIGVAAGCGLAADPALVFDAGACLTFGATLALIVGMPPITAALGLIQAADSIEAPATVARGSTVACRAWREALAKRPALAVARRTAQTAGLLVAATLCVEIVLFPVAIFLFSRFGFAGLLLNLAAVPLMTVVQVAGGAAGMAALVSAPLGIGLGFIAHTAAAGLIESSGLASLAPALAVRVPPPAPWVLGAYLLTLVALVSHARPRVRCAVAAVWLSLAIVVLTGRSSPRHEWAGPSRGAADDRLRLVFFDVGQGDATLVRFPGGTTWLIDAGGAVSPAFDPGERVLAPSLWALGVRRLDRLALSHGDPDHIGGAIAILRDFRPATIWEGVPVPGHRMLEDMRHAARAGHLDWRDVHAPLSLAVSGVDVRLRNPPAPDWERRQVRNDDSLVLELRYRGVQIVLPGDIGRDVERGLAPSMSRGRIVVLKVPHHGSASSSSASWLEALSPAVAIVSAGRANRYSHPAPAVLERYAAIGSRLFRTDRDGAVLVETDGRGLVVRTMTGEDLALE